MTGKRNRAANLLYCLGIWLRLRRYPGLFSLRDAALGLRAVLLPGRIIYRAKGRALAREARIEKLPDAVAKVTVLGQDLIFYWLGGVDNNLHDSIDQEFNPLFPHHYTTPPIQLSASSLVLDVGICEGLFAFRILRARQAARVIGFEPSTATVAYTRRAAEENGVADRLTVESLAVGKSSGRVLFCEQEGRPDSHSIQAEPGGTGGPSVECVSLDDYCSARRLKLTSRDLIKIDAEGSDFDVLQGAERLIREGSPQIAVTTYHREQHALEIAAWLKQIQPRYRMRLKGFSAWTPKPLPVLLQAAL